MSIGLPYCSAGLVCQLGIAGSSHAGVALSLQCRNLVVAFVCIGLWCCSVRLVCRPAILCAPRHVVIVLAYSAGRQTCARSQILPKSGNRDYQHKAFSVSEKVSA